MRRSRNKAYPENREPSNSLRLGKRGKKQFAFYTAAVLCACCFFTPVLAASDPLGVVNNLSSFIFSLIRAIGLILLGWGVVQVGLSFQSHDPARGPRFPHAGGRLGCHFCKEILDLITG